MTGALYAEERWAEAFNAAELHEFCPIDSREREGQLASVVAELREDAAENDEGLLLAAILVAGGLAERFNREFLTRVIESRDEEAEKGLPDRARDYVIARWPDFPVEEIGDLSMFGAKYALHEHERVANDGHGFLFVFDVSELTVRG
ncbi:hypothetical protein [Streptomyces lydicus]|uniref:hypothetical protein n=1 Tax=Streptomyces lydicus TaxID=47763 RepID=UPI0036EB6C10